MPLSLERDNRSKSHSSLDAGHSSQRVQESDYERRAMLTQSENEMLVRTGPGTPMGELFRRFWVPVMLTEEGTGTGLYASAPASAERGPHRLPGHRRHGGDHRRPLRAPVLATVLRNERGEGATVPLPRLEVRRHRPVRGHPLHSRGGVLQGEDPAQVLPRVGQGRVHLVIHGAGRAAASIPGL